ncbi:MAG TPA: KTSC domain-containing protein [Chthoniobacterales bacterium]|jgi:hypothetical protein
MLRKANQIKLIAVDSETMRSVGYDAKEQLLQIEFVSGKLYQYSNVPAAVYQRLLGAESKGGFFNAAIKDSYPFEKLGNR